MIRSLEETLRTVASYDPIIEKFWMGKTDIARVVVPGIDANYIRAQLKKRINTRKMDHQVEVYVVSNVVYLEKNEKNNTQIYGDDLVPYLFMKTLGC